MKNIMDWLYCLWLLIKLLLAGLFGFAVSVMMILCFIYVLDTLFPWLSPKALLYGFWLYWLLSFINHNFKS